MTLAKYLPLFILASSSLCAQQLSHPVMLSRDDAFSVPRPLIITPETVNVLAVMVQFQEDTDSRTSGNGRFDLSTSPDPIIDAPPRNRQYFEDHLTFLHNYYRKSSKGKLIIRSTVPDRVFTLPQRMEAYSPPRNGSNINVGTLAVETWRMVDSSGVVPDFSAYDCFIIFHAGIGRDIDLVSILGFDPTPLDIPSLYLGPNAFKQFFGQDYQGIPVHGGSFRITNSIIMPESENRLLPGLTGNVLLELGINGLLVASVGNFLGLPDLFNTTNGRSGIGRFGLMDGQAIFSYAGVFPPEPSAWEKYWLGWLQPIDVLPGTHGIELPAMGISDSVYRLPVSPREYFLLENRHRDPDGDGQLITSTFNGSTQSRRFSRDTSGFNAFDVSALAGTITDVEDLDWSLPAGPNGTKLPGGTLIWHVDETVIAAGLAGNGVNADPARRGVDVEEADGSQDIGQEFGFLSPGSGSEDGTALDFWYQGNVAPVFRNEFGPNTHPNSLSNLGAAGFITVKEFSERKPRMTAVVTIGKEKTSPLVGFPLHTGAMLAHPALTLGEVAGSGALVITTGNSSAPTLTAGGISTPAGPVRAGLFGWNASGATLLNGSSGVVAQTSSASIPFATGAAIRDLNGDGVPELVVIESGNTGFLRAFSVRSAPGDTLGEQLFAIQLSDAPLTSLVIGDSLIAVAGARGRAFFVRFDGTLADEIQFSPDTTVTARGISRFIGGNTFVITGSNGLLYKTSRLVGGGSASSDVVRNFNRPIAGPPVSGSLAPGNDDARIVFATGDGLVYAVSPAMEIVNGFPVSIGESVTEPPALADIDGDGSRDIIVFGGKKMYALNRAGAILDFFPVTATSGRPFASPPIIGDVDGDGDPDIIGVTGDGLVMAVDRTGRAAAGFPLQAGTGHQTAALITPSIPALSVIPIGLAVASSETGTISAWLTGTSTLVLQHAWPQYQKDASHSGAAFDVLGKSPLSSNFFPPDRAYNWPNPVYDGRTFIRYFVREAASVNIRIFDLAGALVTEFSGPGVGGVDNEIAWDVSGVQSGVYFARIEANGAGENGTAIVKVAIVK